MFSIIAPSEFKTVPWKNGLGETIEVAINSGGTLAHFDWRLSMASVMEDGIFSNFSEYTRNLILIDGDGINLQHNDSKIDRLTNLLDIATFDGGNKTVGNLHTGPITDFNVITRTELYNTHVSCHRNAEKELLESAALHFVFSIDSVISILTQSTNESIELPPQHLVQITDVLTGDIMISGQNVILIRLNPTT